MDGQKHMVPYNVHCEIPTYIHVESVYEGTLALQKTYMYGFNSNTLMTCWLTVHLTQPPPLERSTTFFLAVDCALVILSLEPIWPTMI